MFESMISESIEYYVQAYFLYVVALVPLIAFCGHFTSKEDFTELLHNRWLMFYYAVTLTFCVLNLFTQVLTDYMSVRMAGWTQIVLCFSIFLKRH